MLKKFLNKYILKKLNKKVYPKLKQYIIKHGNKKSLAALALIWALITCLLNNECDSIQKLLEDYIE